jgi:hypothetical protein
MLIHELTQLPSNINEGLWDQVKSAAGKLKQGAQNVRSGLENRAVDAKIKDIATRTAKVWQSFAARRTAQDPNFLTNAAQYRNELKLFLINNLLPKYTNYNSLTVKNEFDQVVDDIVAARASPLSFPDIFKKAADLAAVAQVDPNASSPGPTPPGPTPPGPTPPGPTPPGPASVTLADIMNILNTAGVSNTGALNLGQQLKRAASSSTANRTGNPAIDLLIQALGFNLT